MHKHKIKLLLGLIAVVSLLVMVFASKGLIKKTHSQEMAVATGQGLEIFQPWLRATPPNAKMGAAYMRINNSADQAVDLLRVESDIANAQIHAVKMIDGVMQMTPQKNGVTIAAGQALTLKPQSMHIMLVDLKTPIKEDSEYGLTLVFSDGQNIKITAPALAADAKEALNSHQEH